MPKIRRRKLPPLLMQHLFARVRERKVTLEQLVESSDSGQLPDGEEVL
jgi:hypothetical protein